MLAECSFVLFTLRVRVVFSNSSLLRISFLFFGNNVCEIKNCIWWTQHIEALYFSFMFFCNMYLQYINERATGTLKSFLTYKH